MNNQEIENIVNKIEKGKNTIIEKNLYGNLYKIYFNAPDFSNNINIASIVALPLFSNFSKKIVVETNNCEDKSLINQFESAINTGLDLIHMTYDYPSIIIVPIIPSIDNYPYLQQLSKESLELPENDLYYRIDKQIVNIIDKTKKLAKDELGFDISSKIYLNGYSSSGCFAQRFCLLQPEIIEVTCIGGASGSIPIPFAELNYPLGIGDIKELTGEDFNWNKYRQIEHAYYVAVNELHEKSSHVLMEDKSPAPMHDMSYYDRSVPSEVGKKQREIFGYDMFERSNNIIKFLQNIGMNIDQAIINGIYHADYDNIRTIQKVAYNAYIKNNKDSL